MSLVKVRDLIVSHEPGFACGKARHVDEGLKQLRPFNITGDGRLDVSSVYVVPPDAAPTGKDRLASGDVLFNNTNSVELVGKSALVEDDMRAGFSNHMTRIRLDRDRVEPRYFAYWLRSEQRRGTFSSGCTRWVSQAAYRVEQLGDLSIQLPSLKAQRTRTDQLYVAEGILRLRREAQRKAAELIPALFLDRFGNPASNPKHWRSTALGQLVDRFEGGKNVQAGDEGASPYRILKISAVTSGIYRETESKPAPFNITPPRSHFVRKGDLLISRANTEALVGAVALVEATNGATLLPDKLWRLVWRPGAPINPTFALHLLQLPSMRNALSALASGTGGSMKNISQAKLRELRVMLPPLGEQDAFSAHAVAVASILRMQDDAVAKAQATFDALLHRAFAS